MHSHTHMAHLRSKDEQHLAPLLWPASRSKQSTGPIEIKGPREKLPSRKSATASV